MLSSLQQWWKDWSGQPHPILLVLTTILAAVVATVLLIGTVSTPAILYQAF